MASADTTASITLAALVNNPVFQERCYLRYIVAAISVTNEGAVTNHTQRLAFAGALFANAVNRATLADTILANATNRTNALVADSAPGSAILDNDIDFQVASVFTGIALSRSW
jgi:hypothetical protein